jgi:DNA-binding transcriptional regulator YdaS (Cro superfamily)
MDLKTYLAERGSQTRLALQIEVQPQLVWQWASESRPIPAERCPSLERATEGAVTCEEMRPDVCWHRAADPAWPHPDGRPCIDVAAKVPA